MTTENRTLAQLEDKMRECVIHALAFSAALESLDVRSPITYRAKLQQYKTYYAAETSRLIKTIQLMKKELIHDNQTH